MKLVIDPGAYLPERAHDLDAGYDLRSPIRAYVPPYSSAVIDTGVPIEIPEGYVDMLKSKSGLNVKHDITSEGVIDSGYTGIICVKLYNHGQNAYEVNKGTHFPVLLSAARRAKAAVSALGAVEVAHNLKRRCEDWHNHKLADLVALVDFISVLTVVIELDTYAPCVTAVYNTLAGYIVLDVQPGLALEHTDVALRYLDMHASINDGAAVRRDISSYR